LRPACREELENPKPIAETPTDTVFLELVNLRLDFVEAHHSELHYKDTVYLARPWVRIWGKLQCSQISQQMIERWVLKRSKVSPVAANKEIIHLKALFNWGK